MYNNKAKMRKSWLTVASLALVIALLATVGCVTQTSPESNFNLIFKYGVGAKNELNTFKGTYTKDMILDPPITVRLSLTGEELDRIYQKMLEIDFFSYPDEFSIVVPPGETYQIAHPSSSYYFKVEYNSNIKELRWENKDFAILYPDEKADKLRELIKLIRDIIESKEEYQKLPAPRGAYL